MRIIMRVQFGEFWANLEGLVNGDGDDYDLEGSCVVNIFLLHRQWLTFVWAAMALWMKGGIWCAEEALQYN
jgi:hypothetical protein